MLNRLEKKAYPFVFNIVISDMLKIWNCAHSAVILAIFFFVVFLSGFGVRVMWASCNEFGNFPSCENFWMSQGSIGINTTLYTWQTLPVKQFGHWIVFTETISSISSFNLLFIALFFHDSVLAVCLEIHSFCLGHPICCYAFVHINLIIHCISVV